MIDSVLISLPLAAATAWYLWGRRKSDTFSREVVRKDYLKGLNYLINEQPDKAVDIFIKMLEVDTDTVETHLALGNLFRRRGEVDRAIRVHQNIIARPQLDPEMRLIVMMELGEDYLCAGVLDRAERIFQEVVADGADPLRSLRSLSHIYQQQKDWDKAIEVARKLKTLGERTDLETAHYYCEMALIEKGKRRASEAGRLLTKALQIDNGCVRAELLKAELASEAGEYQDAIHHYKRGIKGDSDYIFEVVAPLAKCAGAINDEQGLITYLKRCLVEHPRTSVMLTLAKYLRLYQGDKAAIEFLAEHIHHHPSLRGMQQLIAIYLENTAGDTYDKLLLLQQLTEKLLANKPVYRCTHCGFAAKTLLWHCPSCRQWSTVKPIYGIEGE